MLTFVWPEPNNIVFYDWAFDAAALSELSPDILGWKYDDLVLRDPWKHCDLSHLSDDAKIPIT